MRKSGLYYGIVISLTVILAGCEREAIDNSRSQMEEQEPDQADDAPLLQFTDAAGAEYEAAINQNVTPHTYDWEGLQREEGRLYYYEEGELKSRTGIDVSRYQAEVNWHEVKQSGVDFAFIRLGYRGYGEEGEIQLDPAYESHVTAAAAAGIDVGVYFFSQAVSEEEALEEAEFVLAHLDDKAVSLPVVFDPEEIKGDDARTDDVTGEQFTSNAIVFCERIREAGYEPMIYTNIYWEMMVFDMEQLEDYEIWYADYEQLPQTPYQFRCWQYSDQGTVAGITGPVDLNIWFDQN